MKSEAETGAVNIRPSSELSRSRDNAIAELNISIT